MHFTFDYTCRQILCMAPHNSPGTGRLYGGMAASERALQRRQRFMEAGLEIFGTDGYRNATVRALCRTARLTDRYFYESFRDTEDLLIQVYLSCTSRLRSVLQPVLVEDRDPNTDLATITARSLDRFFQAVEQNPRMARVVWLEVLGISPAVDQIYNEEVRRFASLLTDLGNRIATLEHLSRKDLELTAIALVGAISQSAQAWMLEGYRTRRSRIVAANTRLIAGLAHQSR